MKLLHFLNENSWGSTNGRFVMNFIRGEGHFGYPKSSTFEILTLLCHCYIRISDPVLGIGFTYGDIVVIWVKRTSDCRIAFIAGKKVDIIGRRPRSIDFLELDAVGLGCISVNSV